MMNETVFREAMQKVFNDSVETLARKELSERWEQQADAYPGMRATSNKEQYIKVNLAAAMSNIRKRQK